MCSCVTRVERGRVRHQGQHSATRLIAATPQELIVDAAIIHRGVARRNISSGRIFRGRPHTNDGTETKTIVRRKTRCPFLSRGYFADGCPVLYTVRRDYSYPDVRCFEQFINVSLTSCNLFGHRNGILANIKGNNIQDWVIFAERYLSMSATSAGVSSS